MTELEKEYEEKHQEWLKVLIPIIEDKDNHGIIRRITNILNCTAADEQYPGLGIKSADCYKSVRRVEEEHKELEQLQKLFQKHGDKFKNGEIVL